MGLAHWNSFRNLMSARIPVRRVFNSLRGIGMAKGERWYAGRWRPARWSPAVDIYETDDAFVLKAELPGFSEEDVHIEVRQHALLLRGARRREFEVAEEHYHCMERLSGPFQRSFLLPARIDSEKVTMSCRDGLLNLRLPKAAANPDAVPSTNQTRIKRTQPGSP
jgi:HSP20 family protein